MDEHYIKSNRSAEPEGTPYAVHVDDATNSSRRAPMGDWDVGLFNCFNDLVPNCAMVTFCPFVSVAQTASKLEVMEKMSAKFRLTPYWFALVPSFLIVVAQYVMLALFINQVAVIFSSDSVVWGYIKYKYNHWGEDETWYIYLILTGVFYVLFAILVWQLRAKAREQLGLQGTWFGDCWTSLWCPCCALAQTATQVKSYTPGSCSFGPPVVDTLPAYSQS